MRFLHYFQTFYRPNDYQLIEKMVCRLINSFNIPGSIPAFVGCHPPLSLSSLLSAVEQKIPQKYLQLISALDESFQTWELGHKINLRGHEVVNRLGKKKTTFH